MNTTGVGVSNDGVESTSTKDRSRCADVPVTRYVRFEVVQLVHFLLRMRSGRNRSSSSHHVVHWMHVLSALCRLDPPSVGDEVFSHGNPGRRGHVCWRCSSSMPVFRQFCSSSAVVCSTCLAACRRCLCFSLDFTFASVYHCFVAHRAGVLRCIVVALSRVSQAAISLEESLMGCRVLFAAACTCLTLSISSFRTSQVMSREPLRTKYCFKTPLSKSDCDLSLKTEVQKLVPRACGACQRRRFVVEEEMSPGKPGDHHTRQDPSIAQHDHHLE